MVVVVIIGVMAAMSMPSFQRAVEQSRADVAVANLRAIWAAERLYWLEPHTYSDAYPDIKNRYTASLSDLQNLGLIDSEIVNGADLTYTYTVTYDPANSTSFTATATRSGGLGSFHINETGDISGTVAVGGYKITSGLQWKSTGSP